MVGCVTKGVWKNMTALQLESHIFDMGVVQAKVLEGCQV